MPPFVQGQSGHSLALCWCGSFFISAWILFSECQRCNPQEGGGGSPLRRPRKLSLKNHCFGRQGWPCQGGVTLLMPPGESSAWISSFRKVNAVTPKGKARHLGTLERFRCEFHQLGRQGKPSQGGVTPLMPHGKGSARMSSWGANFRSWCASTPCVPAHQKQKIRPPPRWNKHQAACKITRVPSNTCFVLVWETKKWPKHIREPHCPCSVDGPKTAMLSERTSESTYFSCWVGTWAPMTSYVARPTNPPTNHLTKHFFRGVTETITQLPQNDLHSRMWTFQSMNADTTKWTNELFSISSKK